VILFSYSSAIAQTNIIGNPIKIGNLLVAQFDFPNKMNWEDATKSCSSLGNGWRLPTKNELNILYSNLGKIGDVGDDGYWTSTENGIERAWRQYLFKEGYSYDDVKYGSGFVRAVGNYGVVKVTPTKARNTKPVQNNAASGIGGFSQQELLNLIIQAELSPSSSNSSNSSSSNLSHSCTFCKPHDSKGWYITDYNASSKIYTNARYLLRPGYKPCSTCHGTGNCKAYNTCSSSDEREGNYTCRICHGDRFELCSRCKGKGVY